MRIAIIGAGAVGTTLGQAWLKRGRDVIWGLRNPADPKHAALPKERVKAPAESVKDAEIVVIATPWSATQACVKGLGSLVGTIVIDCTNPLGMGPDGLQLVLGFEPVDTGPLKNARLLEPFAMVWIDQATKRGRGRDFAFALVTMK